MTAVLNSKEVTECVLGSCKMVLLSTLVAAFCLLCVCVCVRVCVHVCVCVCVRGESMVTSLADFHMLAQPRIWLSDAAK